MMELQVGMILEGRVVSITKFGAFVELEPGRSGLVHISEVSYTFVNDIHDVLTEGQTVKVKVIGIDPNGRISLSVKKTLPPPPRNPAPARSPAPRRSGPAPSGTGGPSGGGYTPAPRNFHPAAPTPAPEPVDFEDRLKRFMKSSDAKMSDLNRHNDKRGGSRGNRRGSRGGGGNAM